MAERSIRVTLDAITGRYKSSMAEAQRTTAQFGSSAMRAGQQHRAAFTMIGAAATLAGGLMIRGLSKAGNEAIRFNATLDKLQTQIGLSVGEMREMGQAAIDLRHTGRGPQELAEAAFFVASAGLRGAEALDVLEMSAKAAAIGLGSTAVVADLVTSAVNAYGSEVLSASAATDVLIATVREGKAPAADLAASMGRVLPFATALGVEFHEVGAAIAAMTRTGTDSQTATTQLRAFLVGISKAAPQSEAALARLHAEGKIGISTFAELRREVGENLWGAMGMLSTAVGDNSAVWNELFPNIRASAFIMDVMGGNVEDNRLIFERMNDTLGLTEEAFATYAQSAQAAQDRFDASMEAFRISVGQATIPVKTFLAEGGTKLLDMFMALPEPIQAAAVAMTGIGAAGMVMLGATLLILPRLKDLIEGFGLLRLAAARVGLGRLALGGAALGGTAIAMGFLAQGLAGTASEADRRARDLMLDRATGTPDLKGQIDLARQLRKEADEAAKHPERGVSDFFKQFVGKADVQERQAVAEALGRIEADLTTQQMLEANKRIQAVSDEAAAMRLAAAAQAGDLEALGEAHTSMSEDAQEAWAEARQAAIDSVRDFADVLKPESVKEQIKLGDLLSDSITGGANQAQFADSVRQLVAGGAPALAREIARMGPEGARAAREAVEHMIADPEGFASIEEQLADVLMQAKIKTLDPAIDKWKPNLEEKGAEAGDALKSGLDATLQGIADDLGIPLEQVKEKIAALGPAGQVSAEQLADALGIPLPRAHELAAALDAALRDRTARVTVNVEDSAFRAFLPRLASLPASKTVTIRTRTAVSASSGDAISGHQGGLVPAGLRPVKMHAGGLASDEVLGVLRRGEFVVRDEVVSQPGMLPLLARMNRMHDGGIVGPISISRGGDGGVPAFPVERLDRLADEVRSLARAVASRPVVLETNGRRLGEVVDRELAARSRR